MKQVIIKFGLLSVALLLLVEVSKYSLLTKDLYTDLLVSIAVMICIGFGLYLGKIFFFKRKSSDAVDHKRMAHLGISKRENEVLIQMAQGKSNNEIAQTLYISESTVKTHVSSLLSKLGAKRRTEALKKAVEWNLIPPT